jgi:hypothetical protein
MADIESAEEFVNRLEDACTCGQDYVDHFNSPAAIPLIEADRNATRIALLAEIRAFADHYHTQNGPLDIRPYCFYKAFLMAETKYTQPVEPGQEKR